MKESPTVPCLRWRRVQPGSHHRVDLPDDLLAIAEDKRVDEVGQGLGVVDAVTACHDERIVSATVGSV
jgi:hypothetical protein